FNVRRFLILLLVAGDLSNSAATATLPVDSRCAAAPPNETDSKKNGEVAWSEVYFEEPFNEPSSLPTFTAPLRKGRWRIRCLRQMARWNWLFEYG
ncbi:hypothetical protein LINGRAHAP2_LOCUS31444, partial [Linum grandiflorum]